VYVNWSVARNGLNSEMCIVLLTTAHPAYALIVIDNRDEFILRPTSRPHWWSPEPKTTSSQNSDPYPSQPPSAPQEILSSRDLQRAEKGTWLGITRSGNLAVLTNYKEDNFHDADNPMHQLRSRGAMVTAWLGADRRVGTREFVEGMVHDGSTKGVGGFSLICGKLRFNQEGIAGEEHGEQKRLKPFAIVSNRSEHPEQIPWIAEERGEVWGLSNSVYEEPPSWEKVKKGKRLLKDLAVKANEQHYDEARLLAGLFSILDDDSLTLESHKHQQESLDPKALDTARSIDGPTPQESADGATVVTPVNGQSPNKLLDRLPFEESLARLSESIFIPALGDAEHIAAMEQAKRKPATETLKGVERPEAGAGAQGFTTGVYGTQRQTVILVDWDGNVTFVERALWDAEGNAVRRGDGDVVFRFKVEE
jgi:uncharacterized protein with NRDE domain